MYSKVKISLEIFSAFRLVFLGLCSLASRVLVVLCTISYLMLKCGILYFKIM